MEDQQTLFPGIPDHIGLISLARVPRECHRVMRRVSRRWKDVVRGDELYSRRVEENRLETWIHALCRDKSDRLCCYVLDPNSPRRLWEPIHVPPRLLERKGVGFEVLGREMYLLGGISGEPSNEVYMCSAPGNTWSEGVSLPNARFGFRCEVVDEKLYVIGGSSYSVTWDAYDPQTSTWTSQPDPTLAAEIQDSFVMDSKIYFRCTRPFISAESTLIYEPSSDTCQLAEEDIARGWRGQAVVVDGTLYVLNNWHWHRPLLRMWKKDAREWVSVGKLSHLRTEPPYQLVAFGKSLFVVGKGLSTDVVDLCNKGTIREMVCSHVPAVVSVGDVISCRCLTG